MESVCLHRTNILLSSRSITGTSPQLLRQPILRLVTGIPRKIQFTQVKIYDQEGVVQFTNGLN